MCKTIVFALMLSTLGVQINDFTVNATEKQEAKPQSVSVKLNKKKVTLLKGKKTRLKITGTKKTAQWTSSNKKIATVNTKGLVTAKAKGVATITAKIGKQKYQCKIIVQDHEHCWQPHYVTRLVKEEYTEEIYEEQTIYETHFIEYETNLDLTIIYHDYVANGGTLEEWEWQIINNHSHWRTEDVPVRTERIVTHKVHHPAQYEEYIDYYYCADDECHAVMKIKRK